jgi:hypothetical protein
MLESDDPLFLEKKEVFQAMDDLSRHGRGEILIVFTPGVVDILAGKRKRFEKGVDKNKTRG